MSQLCCKGNETVVTYVTYKQDSCVGNQLRSLRLALCAIIVSLEINRLFRSIRVPKTIRDPINKNLQTQTLPGNYFRENINNLHENRIFSSIRTLSAVYMQGYPLARMNSRKLNSNPQLTLNPERAHVCGLASFQVTPPVRLLHSHAPRCIRSPTPCNRSEGHCWQSEEGIWSGQWRCRCGGNFVPWGFKLHV